jgi:hypothetical protein
VTAVEPYREQLPDLIPPDKRARYAEVGHLARAYSALDVVPRPYKDNPAAVYAVLVGGIELGMAPSIHLLKRFDVIDGSIEPRSQTLVGLLIGHGHHAWWGHFEADPDRPGAERLVDPSDDTMAEITTQRRDETIRQVWHYTIEEAINAHLVDEWVERWIDNPNGERWPPNPGQQQGRIKQQLERFVLGRPGVDVPEWVAGEIRAGKTKRRDAWHNHRPDMLRNRVAKLAARWTAPELTLGLDVLESPPPLPGEDPGPVGMNAPSPTGPAAITSTYPPPPEHRASTDDRATLHTFIDALDEGPRAWVKGQAVADRIPNIDGPRFSTASRDRLAWHILVGGILHSHTDEAVPADVHDDDPAVNGYDADDDGRPFE